MRKYGRLWVVIPYQVRSYQTMPYICIVVDHKNRRNPLSSQVISNRCFPAGANRQTAVVVIPYQVRSYQTPKGPVKEREGSGTVVIPYQVRSYQTPFKKLQAHVFQYVVVIPYQVRSYQTRVGTLVNWMGQQPGRNPLSSQVISNPVRYSLR